jgi:hypothetical protein
MAKTIANRNSKPGAWIVSPNDKGRKSIKNGKVFLENNSEFEIELFNPLTECVLADIKLNGHSISKSGLVIKPGQRVYLDCFVDDRKKFIFNTYEIDSSEESIKATSKNGLLEVFFYKEDVVTINNWQRRFDRVIVEKWYPAYYPNWNIYPWYPNVYCGTTKTYFDNNISFGGTTVNTVVNTTGTFGNTTTDTVNINAFDTTNASYTVNSNTSLYSSNIETGRVEKGSQSNQKFTEIDMDFEKNYIASTIIQILPESRKPAEIKEVKGNFSNIKTNILKSESDEIIELIKKLADLHSAGILTDNEFSDKKAELLSKL